MNATPPVAPGIVSHASSFTVAETVRRLDAAIHKHGLTRFALIDHSGEAAKVGLAMQEAKLLIFGSPKGGTPLMIASPLLALDLPLKALVWRDAGGAVWVSHNTTTFLADRYSISDNLTPNIAGIDAVIAAALMSGD